MFIRIQLIYLPDSLYLPVTNLLTSYFGRQVGLMISRLSSLMKSLDFEMALVDIPCLRRLLIITMM